MMGKCYPDFAGRSCMRVLNWLIWKLGNPPFCPRRNLLTISIWLAQWNHNHLAQPQWFAFRSKLAKETGTKLKVKFQLVIVGAHLDKHDSDRATGHFSPRWGVPLHSFFTVRFKTEHPIMTAENHQTRGSNPFEEYGLYCLETGNRCQRPLPEGFTPSKSYQNKSSRKKRDIMGRMIWLRFIMEWVVVNQSRTSNTQLTSTLKVLSDTVRVQLTPYHICCQLLCGSYKQILSQGFALDGKVRRCLNPLWGIPLLQGCWKQLCGNGARYKCRFKQRRSYLHDNFEPVLKTYRKIRNTLLLIANTSDF